MNVLFVSGDVRICDTESKSANRMREYATVFGSLHVIVAGGRSSYTDGPLTVEGVSSAGIGKFLVLPKVIARALAKERFDVVSAQDPFEYGLAAYFGCKTSRTPIQFQIHTDFLSPEFIRTSPFLNSMRVRIADWLLPKARGVRVVSKRIHDSLMLRYGSRIVTPVIIPIAIPEVELAPVWRAPYTFTLITIARLEAEKNLTTLLEAMARVKAAYPQAGLVIVGEGRLRGMLESCVDTLGLKSNVMFLGARTDISSLLNGATAYVQASMYEGYGMALIEAARAGLPIISTDVGVVGEVLTPERDVLVIPQRDPEKIAEAVIRLIEDTQFRDTLRLSGQAAAEKHLEGTGDQATRIKESFVTATQVPQG